jgi:sigma-B regulation protein RsbU (phosphoserine phosphatase)
MPLGIFDPVEFELCERALLPGNIVVIGTDGIWESLNQRREMFGKSAVFEIVTENAHRPAGEILQAVIDALERFMDGVDREDDITLVVIKVLPPPSIWAAPGGADPAGMS